MTPESSERQQMLLQEIRRALRHLYDPVYLQRSPLLQPLERERGGLPAGQEIKFLRQTILDLVEQLAPSDNVPLRSERRRPYVALRGHYVDQRDVASVATELNISERHLRRELRAGIEAMGRAYAMRYGPLQDHDVPNPGDTPLDESLGDFRRRRATLDLSVEVHGVLQLLAGLSREYEVEMAEPEADEPLLVASNRVVLRQILLELYTRLLECARNTGGRELATELRPSEDGEDAEITLTGACPREIAGQASHGWVSFDTLRLVDGTLSHEHTGNGRLALHLRLPLMPMHTVLVIDDTHSLHQLFQRYLNGQPIFVRSAFDVDSGLELAMQRRPDLIILDIMMPERDGWEALCALRQEPKTRDIPIVVCSVLQQEALAKSLSASGYLTKPVTQEALLEQLYALGLLDLG